MTRRALNNVANVELDVENVVNDVKTRRRQRRKSQLDVEMPIATSSDVKRPVVKSVVSGQLGVGHVINAVTTRQ